MCAVAAPDGSAVLDGDVVSRAESGALAAAGTVLLGRERPRFDEEGIENRIAHKAVAKATVSRWEHLTGHNGGGSAVNVRLCFGDDLLGFFCLGRVEHGNIILRHADLHRTQIGSCFSRQSAWFYWAVFPTSPPQVMTNRACQTPGNSVRCSQFSTKWGMRQV